MRALALIAILSASALLAQDTDPERAYKIGGGVAPPKLIRKVEPEYSKEARMVQLVGTVALRFTVGTNGKARDFQVLRSLGLGLDEKAIAAVTAWLFEPGTKDGQPVNTLVAAEINFRLRNVRWIVSRMQFVLPDGASPPTVEKTAAPRLANDPGSGKATLTFDVNGQGSPVNITTDQASTDSWSRDVAESLSRWRFKPASKDRHSISVSCTMDFAREK